MYLGRLCVQGGLLGGLGGQDWLSGLGVLSVQTEQGGQFTKCTRNNVFPRTYSVQRYRLLLEMELTRYRNLVW